MTNKIFVTGTDTNVGKTYISVGLLHAFNQAGFSTIGIKPIATGATLKNKQLVNEDALSLQKAASIKLDYNQVNPIVYEPAIPPHMAATLANETLSVKRIYDAMHSICNQKADVCIIEGVGGWHVPLNQTETMADYVIAEKLSIILVVNIKLGCLNHAILTDSVINQTGLVIKGWIANTATPTTDHEHEYIATLKQWLKYPLLGSVQYRDIPETKLDILNLII